MTGFNYDATWQEQASNPSTPDTGKWKIYPKSDGFYILDDAGVATKLNSGGVLNNFSATTAPAVTDDSGDGYSIGSVWINTTTDNIYAATDVSVGAAVWKLLNSLTQYTTINIVLDGGGSVIVTGIKADLVIDFACTIAGVTMLSDQSGAIQVDIWKDTYANFPPTNADSITGAAEPEIASGSKSQDTTLTGWTTAISAGDILRFNVDSVTNIERVTLALKVQV